MPSGPPVNIVPFRTPDLRYALDIDDVNGQEVELVDGLEEIFLNWRDAIIKAHNLSPAQFKPVVDDQDNRVQVTVYHPDKTHVTRNRDDGLLGYIEVDATKTAGLNATIFGVQPIVERHRFIGPVNFENNTSDNLVPVAWEGFQVAALIFRRRGYCPKFAASGYSWEFVFCDGYKGTKSYCNMSLSTDDVNTKCGSLQEAPTKDISFTLRPYSLDIHNEWLKTVVGLKSPPPEHVIHTIRGSILLRVKNRIYLNHLRIETPGNQYRYGYTIFCEDSRRDRRAMDAKELSRFIGAIWADAMAQNEDTVIPKALDQFQIYPYSQETKILASTLSEQSAKLIWRYLLRTNEGCFYHRDEAGEEKNEDAFDSYKIREYLKKEPEPLPKALWDILTGYHLVRSADQQRILPFGNSQPSTLEVTENSSRIRRGLKACLAYYPQVRDISVVFVERGNMKISFHYKRARSLRTVHEKWLDPQRVLGSDLRSMSETSSDLTVCDQRLDALCGLVVFDINNPVTGEVQTEFDDDIKFEAPVHILQMPRKVTIATTEQQGELIVSWEYAKNIYARRSFWGNNRYYIIFLHRERTCADKRDDLLLDTRPHSIFVKCAGRYEAGATIPGGRLAPCGCPRTISHDGQDVSFTGLNDSEAYFPMVAVAVSRAPFGYPPPAIRPREYLRREYLQLEYPQREAPAESRKRRRISSPPGNSIEPPRQRSRGDTQVSISSPNQRERSSSLVVSDAAVGDSSADSNDAGLWDAFEETVDEKFNRFRSNHVAAKVSLTCRSNLYSLRLGFIFQKEEYSLICISQPGDASGADAEYIVYVHDICSEETSDGSTLWYLLVTKFSFLKSYPFISACNDDSDTINKLSKCELLMHFEDYKSMGKRHDAELIGISNITDADNSEIRQVGPDFVGCAPDDTQTSSYFCRFAIQGGEGAGAHSLTPLASAILPHGAVCSGWPLPIYKTQQMPSVWDLTPGVLGLSEGFSQASFDVAAAISFDPSDHTTWKLRHHSAQVCDDITQAVHMLPGAPKHVPEIAVVSGPNRRFSLHASAAQGTSIKQFLEPLNTFEATLKATFEGTVDSARSFDFMVLTMPAAALHDLVFTRLVEVILQLLERRYAVHLRLLSLPEHGIPQDRKVLVLIASPVCITAPWGDAAGTRVPSKPTVGSLIGDLALNNPHVNRDRRTSFAFRPPGETNSIIHNHQTGRQQAGSRPVILNTNAVRGFLPEKPPLAHPTRGDVLTVRELARIQGFPDDFLFMQSLDSQYKQVMEALPPSIGKMIAGTILAQIREYEYAELDEESFEDGKESTT